jgi:tubulin-folding cofactor B
MINNEDLRAIQHYVTSGDPHANLHSDTLILDLTHCNLIQRHIEIRFDKHTTVSSLRDKIFQTTGTPPHFQHLQLISGGTVFCEIEAEKDSDKMLGYYNLAHGMTCHCIDLDPHSKSAGGQYEDTSLVKRYVMSEEDYDKRKGTLRDWGRKKKEQDSSFSLARHAKEHREMMEAQRQAKAGLELPKGFEFDSNGKVVRSEVEANCCDDNKENEKCCDSKVEYDEETVKGIKVGMRCQARPGNRRGSVAFVGEIAELGTGGYWTGIIFDEPVGKTDGTTKTGVRYFDAPGPRYGGFVRGKNLDVGDFPERDIMDELEDSDDEI